MKTINIILAATENNVIGDKGKLIWDIPTDMEFFKEKTIGNVVIMGRKTYESLSGPLPNRTNVIITKNKNYKADGCIIEESLTEAINKFKNKEIYIIGGSEIFKEAFKLNDTIHRVYLTRVLCKLDGDCSLPNDFLEDWVLVKESEVKEENGFKFKFLEYI